MPTGTTTNDHKHSGIALLPPEVVQSGRVAEVIANRQEVLDAASTRHSERFVRGRPQALQLPAEVGINLPRPHVTEPTTATAAAEMLALDLNYAPHCS